MMGGETDERVADRPRACLFPVEALEDAESLPRRLNLRELVCVLEGTVT